MSVAADFPMKALSLGLKVAANDGEHNVSPCLKFPVATLFLRRRYVRHSFRVKPELQIRKNKGSAFRIDTKWTTLPRHFCRQSLNFTYVRSTETDFT